MPRVLTKAQPFVWPIQPRKLLQFLLGFPGFLWPLGAAAYYGLAALTWRYLQPGADQLSNFSQLSAEWILPMYARNVVMLVVVAGSLHVILYRRRTQGTRFKYNARWPSRSKAFLFNDQVKDNAFWSVASGATIWTLYEALMLWAYGNGWVPFATLRDNPVWFFGLAAVLPFWQDLHFYVVHRISHWKPFYKAAHYLHHKNTNVGPWSGLSMHPLEHIVYFTRWIILFLVPSHPIHMFYLMQRPALNPAIGHTGFDQIITNKETDRGMSIDSFSTTCTTATSNATTAPRPCLSTAGSARSTMGLRSRTSGCVASGACRRRQTRTRIAVPRWKLRHSDRPPAQTSIPCGPARPA